MNQNEPVLYSRTQAATLLGCSEATLDRMIRRGQLAAIRIGKRRIVITLDEIQRLLSDGMKEATEQPGEQVGGTE